jgi:signal transduction histidine kinase
MKKQISLNLIWIFPFMIQMFATVSLIGYFSYRNGEKAISEMVDQLTAEISSKVTQNLNFYLKTPHDINKNNLGLIDSGFLDLDNLEKWENHLWRQIQNDPNLAFMLIATEKGQQRTGERLKDNSLLINTINPEDNFEFRSYNTNNKGEKISLHQTLPDKNPVQFDWYKEAIKNKKATWSSTHVSYTEDILLMSAVVPIDINQDQQFEGILSSAIRLDQISNFLSLLKIGKSGQAFIINKQGEIIATSTGETSVNFTTKELILAKNSQDNITKFIAESLELNDINLENINEQQQLNLDYEKESYYTEIIPYKDDFGLDWLIVLTVPKSDFMTEINANTQTTIILCLLALIVATIIAILTSRLITKPIITLSQASKAISEGNLEQKVEIKGIKELNVLAQSFNKMAQQILKSFQDLQIVNDELEQKVIERTEKLIESEKMAALGQLVAGIAHEINTPLGAIRASIHNSNQALKVSLNKIPQIFQKLDVTEQKIFFQLIENNQNNSHQFSTREERKYRKNLTQQLENQGIDSARNTADLLIDIGIHDNIDSVLPLLKHSESKEILNLAYNLAGLQRNSSNIMIAVERASKVVFALKNYAHYDSSGKKQNVFIYEGIDLVLELYHNQIKQGIEVTRNYNFKGEFLCYPDELIQVWTNLIHNSIQAMKGKGKLVIDVTEKSNFIIVKIQDSGGGIPLKIQDKIFDPFFTTKPIGEGTGLGLDIVRRIVNKHQGKINLESEEGKTIFTVELPILTDSD